VLPTHPKVVCASASLWLADVSEIAAVVGAVAGLRKPINVVTLMGVIGRAIGIGQDGRREE